METRFVRVDYKDGSASLEEHRTVVEAQATEEFAYAGYIPAEIGANGQLLSVDLVFQRRTKLKHSLR